MLAARNRFLMTQCEDLSFRPVLARTAKFLLDVSHSGQQAIDRREHSIQEMSARIGTVPEVISRCLGIFKSKDLIIATRTAITVSRPEALAKLAQTEPASRISPL